MSDELTLTEARRIREPIVYGLADATGIFYVGQTARPAQRFATHARANSTNRMLNERIRTAGMALRVHVLRRSPDDLCVAERAEIAARSGLVNVVGADHWSWSLHNETKPWVAARDIQHPSAWARIRTGPDAALDAMLATMSPARRCAYELELLASLHPIVRRRFDGWLARAGPKMRAALEAA